MCIRDRIFGTDNYFLELQDHGIPEEDTVRAGLVEIARRTGLPLVATNDSHYIKPEDEMCIRDRLHHRSC